MMNLIVIGKYFSRNICISTVKKFVFSRIKSILTFALVGMKNKKINKFKIVTSRCFEMRSTGSLQDFLLQSYWNYPVLLFIKSYLLKVFVIYYLLNYYLLKAFPSKSVFRTSWSAVFLVRRLQTAKRVV